MRSLGRMLVEGGDMMFKVFHGRFCFRVLGRLDELDGYGIWVFGYTQYNTR